MILAGDIGGTNTRLALFEGPEPRNIQVFHSASYPTLAAIAREYLAAQGQRVETACFGIAGPVRNGAVEATNLPWKIHAAQLAAELGLAQVRLLNDLEANAYGIDALPDSDFAVLRGAPADPRGNRRLICPVRQRRRPRRFCAAQCSRDCPVGISRPALRPRELRARSFRPGLGERLPFFPRRRLRPGAFLAGAGDRRRRSIGGDRSQRRSKRAVPDGVKSLRERLRSRSRQPRAAPAGHRWSVPRRRNRAEDSGQAAPARVSSRLCR